jgi:hypothetical protein
MIIIFFRTARILRAHAVPDRGPPGPLMIMSEPEARGPAEEEESVEP